MKPTDDNINLEWCYQHRVWFVSERNSDCPQCEIDKINLQHQTIVEDLNNKIKDIQEIIDNLPEVPF
jgi:hypothetical protein